jgi:hypothetical protein
MKGAFYRIFGELDLPARYRYTTDTICILGIFEPDARFDVIHMDLAGMEWGSSTFTVGSIHCTNGSLASYDFFSDVHPCVPVFISAPEAFEYEQFFSYDGFFCGVGVVPGLGQESLGLVLVRHDEFG